jgi:hypothetical protein
MNENDDRRNAPKEPDRLLTEITTAMKMLADAELLHSRRERTSHGL